MKAIALEKPPLDHIVKTIVERFNPRRIVMFGSYATGNAGPDSDLDLLLEMETELSKPYREIEVHRLFRNRGWAMDVFVYTPEEVRTWRDSVGSIVHTAEAEGTILYERS